MTSEDNERARLRQDIDDLRTECLRTGRSTGWYLVDGFAGAAEAVLRCPALLQTTLEALRRAFDDLAADVRRGLPDVSSIPLEFTGEAWEALARRLGFADTVAWIRSGTLELQPFPTGWQASWIRLYDGVRSDRRWVSAPSLPELCAQINVAEDEGDRDDDQRRAEGEDLPFAEVVR